MPIVSVAKLNLYIKSYIEQNLKLTDLWVSGEIFSIKHHHNGHIYMILKDGDSAVRAIVFKGNAQKLKLLPVRGMRIIAFGKISMYEKEGYYQLLVEKLVPDGVGELYVAFEQLKKTLESKGLFSAAHKKTLPEIPKKIGIVTSISGAALKDIVSVTKRRYPIADLIIYPALVQGDLSCDSVCNGINFLDSKTECDVIILARGGGNIEDLWSFNCEKMAYAIFNCSKPIISAIGHETDFTIADYVADVRAPTPSAAAEIVVPSSSDLKKHIIAYQKRLVFDMQKKLETLKSIFQKTEQFDFIKKEKDLIKTKKENLNFLIERLNSSIARIQQKYSDRLQIADIILNKFNPDNVLKLGYSLLYDNLDKLVVPERICVDDMINIKTYDRKLKCIVKEIDYDKHRI